MADVDVFDFHMHGYGFADGADWTGRIRAVLDSGEVSGVLCCTDLNTEHEAFEDRNADLLTMATTYGKNRLPLAAMVHPNRPDWQKLAPGWFDRHPELVAIKLKPEKTNCPIRPEVIDPIFDFAMERDLIVVSHTSPEPGYQSMDFMPSLKRRRDVKLVLYHASLNEQAAYLAAAFPNVYVEPSWLGFFPHLFSMMRNLGGYRKLLAGTDGPGWFDGFEGSPYQDLVTKARGLLPDEQSVQAFCSGNARRLLGL